MYTIGNVMNVRGHDVQCTLLDKNGNHVRTFYFDKEEQVIWCHNYPELAKEYGQGLHVRISVHVKTKKQAEELMRTEAMLERMVDVVRGMVVQLAQLKVKRQEAREAKKVEAVEPKPVYKHEIFTDDTETYKTLANHTELASLKCWHLNDDSEYYRITLESHKDASHMLDWLVQESFSFDDVITEVLDVQ